MTRSATLISVLAIALGPWCGSAEAKPNLGKKLLKAALQGDTGEVQSLLAQGAEPNYSDKEGCTPVIAATGGCSSAMEVDARGRISLTATEGRGSVEMVRALLGAGARPNVANPRGFTALMYAAIYGRTESVRALLDAQADPNLKDADNTGALHRAAHGGQPEIVSLLIQRGAILDAKGTVSVVTPLGLAAGEGHLDVVRILLAAGANAKDSDAEGQTCLILAAYGGYVEVMNVLVAAGADVMAHDKSGYTPLSNAAYSGHASAVAWLLDHGAEVNARAKDGTTAMTLAKKRGHLDVARLLETRGGTESP